jgi:hypothetical protein
VSDRESEGYKSELVETREDLEYASIELILLDRELASILCKIHSEVYKDALIVVLKRVLRPASRFEIERYIMDLISMNAFSVRTEKVELIMPRELYEKRKARKKKKKEETQPLDAEIQHVIYESWKVVLQPSSKLRSVCQVKGYY